MVKSDVIYRGRFAPSPTGPLHLGSLYTAVASFLQARSKGGKWLVRIDDLDPSRCRQIYSTQILRTLEQYCLTWDDEVFYQSYRTPDYKAALDNLSERQLLYPCQCSRKDLENRQPQNSIYDGYCLSHVPTTSQATVLRIKLPNEPISLIDAIQGNSTQDLKKHVGDFVMFRKDQVYAYHLAVVLDDNEQGITEILRGYDLLDSTYRQIYLQQILGIHTPYYAHIPVINGADGEKLSKQTHASDVSLSPIQETLIAIFKLLNLNPPTYLLNSTPSDILSWGINNWSLHNIKQNSSVSLLTH